MEGKQIILITFLSTYVAFVLIEATLSIRLKRKYYNFKDSLSNTFIVLVNQLIRPLAFVWAYFLFKLVEPFQLFQFEFNALTLIGAFLGVEFMYYWYHRLSHEIPLLWTLHNSHHSSIWFNFSTAGRINWLDKFVIVGLYIPLILAGFSPELISLILFVNLFYQLLLHTQFIQKLGFLEGVLNTPSAHRVHHGRNEEYLDKNYGGILMIYDRIFNTYKPETAKVKFGVTTGFIGHNPITIVFQPLFNFLKSTGSKCWSKFQTNSKSNKTIMKNLNSKSSKTILTILITLLFLTTFSSCEEEVVVFTIDDAAELVAFTMAGGSYGLLNSITYTAQNITEFVDCGETNTDDRTVSITAVNGSLNSTINIAETYSRNCDNTESISYAFIADQILTSVRINLNQDLSANWIIDDLDFTNELITYNGDYDYTGDFQYNLDINNIVDINFESELINVAASPEDGQIKSGKQTFLIMGISTSYEDFVYQGEIVFRNDNTAIVTFSTGEKYEIDFETGEIYLIE